MKRFAHVDIAFTVETSLSQSATVSLCLTWKQRLQKELSLGKLSISVMRACLCQSLMFLTRWVRRSTAFAPTPVVWVFVCVAVVVKRRVNASGCLSLFENTPPRFLSKLKLLARKGFLSKLKLLAMKTLRLMSFGLVGKTNAAP
mmetsp:Transcript_37555/g.65697  ORF Transcript_37555/g.65697 Transcript_37555/m.65697 type:complete len:144 (+) Transcript_37555:339-770(+)